LRTYAGTTTYSAKDRGGNGLFVFDQTLDVQLDRLVRRSVSSRVDPGDCVTADVLAERLRSLLGDDRLFTERLEVR